MATPIKYVSIFTIPHKQQRYDTCGDWAISCDHLYIWVSELGDWRMTMAAAYHEFLEATACNEHGVDEKEVTAFDIQFELARAHGEVPEDAEPGEDTAAPYRREHAVADVAERLFCTALDVPWTIYDNKVSTLEYYDDAPTDEKCPEVREEEAGEGRATQVQAREVALFIGQKSKESQASDCYSVERIRPGSQEERPAD